MEYFNDEGISEEERRYIAFQVWNGVRGALSIAKRQEWALSYERTLDVIHEIDPDLYTDLTKLLTAKNESELAKRFKEAAEAESTPESPVTALDLLGLEIQKYDSLHKKARSEKKKRLQQYIYELHAAKKSLEPRRLSEHRVLSRDGSCGWLPWSRRVPSFLGSPAEVQAAPFPSAASDHYRTACHGYFHCPLKFLRSPNLIAMRCHSLLNTAIACFFSSITGSGSFAQITEIGSMPEQLLVVRSLTTAGVKLYSSNATSLTLYNLDLNVYATIPYPPLPTGYNYFSVLYITESTFDTDPLSIELMMLTQSDTYISGTRVFRDDGTILLDELGYSFSGVGGYDEVNAKPPLFTDENGVVYLALTTYPTNPPTASKLLQLPGSLPCVECSTAEGLGLRPEGTTMNGGLLSVFPNPTSEHVTVDIELPPGISNGRLLVHDALGKLVANIPVSGSGKRVIPMIGRANGNYTCVLITDGQRSQAKQFVLER